MGAVLLFALVLGVSALEDSYMRSEKSAVAIGASGALQVDRKGANGNLQTGGATVSATSEFEQDQASTATRDAPPALVAGTENAALSAAPAGDGYVSNSTCIRNTGAVCTDTSSCGTSGVDRGLTTCFDGGLPAPAESKCYCYAGCSTARGVCQPQQMTLVSSNVVIQNFKSSSALYVSSIGTAVYIPSSLSTAPPGAQSYFSLYRLQQSDGVSGPSNDFILRSNHYDSWSLSFGGNNCDTSGTPIAQVRSPKQTTPEAEVPICELAVQLVRSSVTGAVMIRSLTHPNYYLCTGTFTTGVGGCYYPDNPDDHHGSWMIYPAGTDVVLPIPNLLSFEGNR